jgi:putative hydrolase of the HAD superfamily
MAAQRELFVLRDDALTTFTELRARGLRVGVLSDCSAELAQAWAQLPLAGLVDARVLSCEEGRRKPDPELFHLIARHLDAVPQDCLYVGDGGGGELTGASKCGMQAFMLRAADRADNDAHSREDDWPGPALPTPADVLTLVDGSRPTLTPIQGPDRPPHRQAEVVRTVVDVIVAQAEQLNLSGYTHFALRDADSSLSGLFHQFGLPTDTYEPKPAFDTLRTLVDRFSR